MRVLVDDQLALLANLGVLRVPDDVEPPLLTVYSFQLRIASAVAVDRPTHGVLRRLVAAYHPPGARREVLAARATSAVSVVDPTRAAVDVARAKAELGCNLLAAEVVAVAASEGVDVRLSAGNARPGQLVDALVSARVPYAVWELVPEPDGLSVREPQR